MSRYVIIGAGAVGASLAVEFGDQGHEVQLVAQGRTLEHLSRRPLTYHTHAGAREVRLAVSGPADELDLRIGDLIVLAVKTQDVYGVLPDLAWRAVRDAAGVVVGTAADLLPVVTIQNGLDSERAAARWFEVVAGAVFLVSARYARVGEVHVGGHPALGGAIVGPASGSFAAAHAAAETFVTDLRAANFLAELVDDIGPYKAAKILWSVRNGLEVLAGERSVKDDLGLALTDEARRVLAAAGIAHRDRAELILDPAQQNFSARTDATHGQQSTWQSFARGTSNEVDFLNGEIALLARRHGVPAPLNTALQRILGRATRAGGGLDLPGLDELVARRHAG